MALARARAAAKFNIFTSLAEAVQGDKLIAIKDNIATKTFPTTCSSNALRNYTSPFDATVVELLSDYEVLGKTNMDEFGMGAGTTHSAFGPTLNPLFPGEERICGGSSGGSAAAVASGCVSVALGTDTGGSVRQPASYTGILGFKPSYGRVSRWGVVAYAQSLDTVGILGDSIDAVHAVFDKIDRYDPKDPTSVSLEMRKRFNFRHGKKLRIGIPEEMILGFSSLVSQAWEDSLQRLAISHEIVPVSIPLIKLALPVYFTLAPAEASSNLARYDGIRYGTRADNDRNHYSATRSQGFGDEVKRRIMLGNYNLNSDAYQNHFIRAQQLRAGLKEQFNQVFNQPNVTTNTEKVEEGVDFLLTPTTVGQAPTMKEFEAQTSAENFIQDVLTIPASLAGIPAISFPWDFEGEKVGLQLMGQYGDDKGVLDATRLIMGMNIG